MYKKLFLCISLLLAYNTTSYTGFLSTFQNFTFQNRFVERFGVPVTAGLLALGYLGTQERSLNKEVLTAGLISTVITEFIYPFWAPENPSNETSKQLGILKRIFEYKAGITIALGLGSGYVYHNYFANH